MYTHPSYFCNTGVYICIYTYKYMYTYMYIIRYIYVYMHTYTYSIRMCLCAYVPICIYTHMWLFLYMAAYRGFDHDSTDAMTVPRPSAGGGPQVTASTNSKSKHLPRGFLPLPMSQNIYIIPMSTSMALSIYI